jgi:uncharacterized membrane protein
MVLSRVFGSKNQEVTEAKEKFHSQEFYILLLVEALCYKLEGRQFESRIRWIFSIYLILPVALWPWGRLSI